jgi:uncharacterized membrane protein
MSREKQKLLVATPGLTKENVVLFGDAIFSIAITLLVLDIKLPDVQAFESNALFIQGLAGTLPKFMGFFISFFVIALYWRGYHRIAQYLKRFSGAMLLLNIVFLFMIAFMPFPTSLLGEAGGSVGYIVIFYQSVMALTSIIMYAMWRYAAGGDLLIEPGLDRRLVGVIAARTLIPAVVFIVTIPLAFYSITLTELCWIFIAPLTMMAKWYYGVEDAKFFD